MTKSALAVTMDELQARLSPLLRQSGFRKHGRTHNRTTADGLTHVVGFQMGAFDPPGTTYFPPLTQNLYGRFTVNLGVYVPEVARTQGCEAKSVAHDYNCCVRKRLGRSAEGDIWWRISANESLFSELQDRLQNDAFEFFGRFETRDQILDEFRTASDNTEIAAVPRIICALIHLGRSNREKARELLAAQARDSATGRPHHATYVVGLAKRLGIEITS